jgi:hypothetical protein
VRIGLILFETEGGTSHPGGLLGMRTESVDPSLGESGVVLPTKKMSRGQGVHVCRAALACTELV